MTKEQFNPFIEGAEALTAEDIDRHVESLPKIAYYGERPDGIRPELVENHKAIAFEDDSGISSYSVLMSGDLVNAEKVLIKTMPWSDSPGRGFEALRQALIADPSQKLAVVGVSFPGLGDTKYGLTEKQTDSLKGAEGDFAFIAAQQWRAIIIALKEELSRDGLSKEEAKKKLASYNFLLSGSSQGASNAVGLLQSLPEGINATTLGLLEDTSFEERSKGKFMYDFVLGGSKHFKDYVSVNSYNEYDQLGPPMNLLANIYKHPGSHLGAVISAMARGGGKNRILNALRQKELKDFEIRLGAAEHDRVAKVDSTKLAALALNASGIAVAQTVIWKGHYHPVMENLSNAQLAFRSLAR